MTTLDPARVHVTPADAEKLTFLGMDLYWLVTREMSDGAFAPVPCTCPRPGPACRCTSITPSPSRCT